jgi:hypothetical protein
MRHICTSIVATLVLAGMSFAATINVPADYATIQEAIDAASDGDEIVIAPGTYTGSGGEVANLLDKQITLRASGSAEETIIDGENERRGLTIGGSNNGVTVQGLTITKGYANLAGGLHFSGPSVLNCIDCKFTHNTGPQHGGAGGSEYGTASFVNCLFENNTGGGAAGGVGSIGNLTMTNCTFSNNTASGGGGVNIHGGNSLLTECVFENNSASVQGGGVYIFGLAGDVATLIDCVFRNNSAYYEGGGAWCYSDGAEFQNCTFESNTANVGGGAFNRFTDPNYTDCLFVNNSGLAIYNQGNASGYCSPHFTNCLIEGNVTGGWSGGISTNYGHPNIDNCVIRNNADYGIRTLDGQAIIYNSIICGNSPVQIEGPWEGSDNSITDICDDDNDGISNDDDNCVLYNPDQADCNENGIGDVCDIADGVSEDINGNEIPDECDCLADVVVDGEVNINDVLVTISSWGTSGPLGDVNYDGIVDVEDLLIVISAWGPCP